MYAESLFWNKKLISSSVNYYKIAVILNIFIKVRRICGSSYLHILITGSWLLVFLPGGAGNESLAYWDKEANEKKKKATCL